MATEFDVLINSEVIVDDVSVAERVFVDKLGFPEPKPAWSGKKPGFGFTFLFARVHPSMAVSPTRIEAMAVSSIDPSIEPEHTIPFLPGLLAAQGDRPWKTHGNELATSDMEGVLARLAGRGGRYYLMPRSDNSAFARLWLGWTAEDPGAYTPDTDGGLLLEICETEGLMQGDRLFSSGLLPKLPPGAMVRVLQRSWIVEDLDWTLSALATNFDWRPKSGPEVDPASGCRRAVFGFRAPRSAELELLEPVAPGAVAESLRTWGPGSWAIRIGVNDIEAKANDLRRRKVLYEDVRGSGATDVLRVDTGTFGVPGIFDFAGVI